MSNVLGKNNQDHIQFVAQNINTPIQAPLKFNVDNGSSVQSVYKCKKSGNYTISINMSLINQWSGSAQVALSVWVNSKQIGPKLYSTVLVNTLSGLSTINGIILLELNKKDNVEFRVARITGIAPLIVSSLDSISYIKKN